MEVEATKCSSGYRNPPWIFKGSALYQLHLVKAETARAVIPKEFRVVEAFGYTLGGFFLASYEDTPAGAFDEVVHRHFSHMSPIVKDEHYSKWAARVLVNSDEACDHGRKHVGLPSQVARFTKRSITAVQGPSKSTTFNSFLNMIGLAKKLCPPKDLMDVHVSEIKGPAATDICNIKLGTTLKYDKWMGPAIKMSLPSFSGYTQYNPNLLKYSCHIKCRVRVVEPAKVSGPSFVPKEDTEQALGLHGRPRVNSRNEELIDNGRSLSISVMLSRPIIALEFNCLTMIVEAPIVVSNNSKSSFKFS